MSDLSLLALSGLRGEHVDLSDVRARDDLLGARAEGHGPRVHGAVLHGADLLPAVHVPQVDRRVQRARRLCIWQGFDSLAFSDYTTLWNLTNYPRPTNPVLPY